MRLNSTTSTLWYFPPDDDEEVPKFSVNQLQDNDIAHGLKDLSSGDILSFDFDREQATITLKVAGVDAGTIPLEQETDANAFLASWNQGLKLVNAKTPTLLRPTTSSRNSVHSNRRSKRVSRNSQTKSMVAADDPLTKVTDFLAKSRDQILEPRDMTIRILTWNLHGELLYEQESFEDFSRLLRDPEGGPLKDVYICGFQETIPLTAKNLHHSPVAIEGWCNALLDSLKKLDPNEGYRVLSTNALLGLTTIVVTKETWFEQFSRVESQTIGTGLLGVWGNKGAITTRFVLGADFSAGLDGLTFQHINCHLAAGESAAALLRRRTELYDIEHRFGLAADKVSLAAFEDKEDEILSESLEELNAVTEGPNPRISLDYSSDEDESFIPRSSLDTAKKANVENAVQALTLDDDASMISYASGEQQDGILFISGDLNYRVGLSPEIAQHLVKNKNYQQLLENDSLLREKSEEKVFIGMCEGPIEFMPTYKYVDTTDDYDYLRTPSFTDRVLFSEHETLKQTHYSNVPELKSSDHRPVISDFQVRVPYINMPVRKALLAGYYKELDALENSSRPVVTVTPLDLGGDVNVLTPLVVSSILKNNGETNITWKLFDTSGETLMMMNRLDDGESSPRPRRSHYHAASSERSKFLTSSVKAIPSSGTLAAGASQKLEIEARAPIGASTLEGVYILRIGDGQDFFLSYKFGVLPTFLGKSVDDLTDASNHGGLPENICQFTDFLMDKGFPQMFTRALDWSGLDTLNQAVILSNLEQEIIADVNEGRSIDYEMIAKFDSISGQRREGTRSVANMFYLLMKNLKDGVIPLNMSVYLINTYYKGKKSFKTREGLVSYLLDTISPGRANLLIFLCSFFRHLYEQKGVSIAVIYGLFENLLVPLPKVSRIRLLSTSSFRTLKKRRRELLNILILD
ncbi:unnamed protein product [Kuraishia capsulata CBS 1993]|uniref:Inositol polyphosphate-related phosphatase domain-containing protein n=1 Tax=Kuraishia capsulata CBS 1993 TaxID=1382522 RepID=W6MH04_9ASCO|nr:uncharacterized protein KUCA_T00000875001 [Kuraishia capsulata CBS 1993]CDK24908.1 unnamed protein product [Kuraishia capsulata CBS 1993]